ncbi:HET domain-containing protein [Fusarium falciforme]|uniref:HET domain-containing protein n=1 Tax=Fusarium falciforme TaxID=195108 RepID=UPI0023002735|nr:HET domain-containing protein [Fusarium falciforme]WAO91487.1 HET domain-containing protein [Fusarium falciforme]
MATLTERKSNIPWESLPKTFQDAISLVRKLGYQYIWIDSLCIIQDDPQDWELEASRMASIYQNSQLTIAASRAIDSSQGLFSIRENEPFPWYFPWPEDTARGTESSPEVWKDFNVPTNPCDGIPGLHFRIKHPCTLEGCSRSIDDRLPLWTRSWCFQERLLSHRVIHFGDTELIWECREAKSCECSGARFQDIQGPPFGYGDTSEYSDLYLSIIQHSGFQRPGLQPSADMKSHFYDSWDTLVENYTALRLTFDSDRLPALSGIACGFEGEYLAGVWRDSLPVSLLWTPTPGFSMVPPRRPDAYRAPSWSWASVEAPVTFVKPRTHFRKTAIATVSQADCTRATSNLYGRVLKGSLTLRTRIFTARVVKIVPPQTAELDFSQSILPGIWGNLPVTSQSELPGVKLDVWLRAKEGSHTAAERFEYLSDPVRRGKEVEEVKAGDVLTIAQITHTHMLALKEVDSSRRIFRRVGLWIPYDPQDDVDVDWVETDDDSVHDDTAARNRASDSSSLDDGDNSSESSETGNRQNLRSLSLGRRVRALARELRGSANNRLVEDTSVAVQHNLGLGGAVVVNVYKRADGCKTNSKVNDEDIAKTSCLGSRKNRNDFALGDGLRPRSGL